MARLNDQKNPLYLIDLFYHMKKIKENILLVYVGDGNLKERVWESIYNYGIQDSVIHIPVVKNAGEVLSGMDAFLLPSLYEGFPTVAIEAQANGLKCFLSDSITKEIALTNLVSFFSLNDLIENVAQSIITQVHERKENDLGGYNETIRKSFDAQIVTDTMVGIYTK